MWIKDSVYLPLRFVFCHFFLNLYIDSINLRTVCVEASLFLCYNSYFVLNGEILLARNEFFLY